MYNVHNRKLQPIRNSSSHDLPQNYYQHTGTLIEGRFQVLVITLYWVIHSCIVMSLDEHSRTFACRMHSEFQSGQKKIIEKKNNGKKTNGDTYFHFDVVRFVLIGGSSLLHMPFPIASWCLNCINMIMHHPVVMMQGTNGHGDQPERIYRTCSRTTMPGILEFNENGLIQGLIGIQ